MKIRLSLLAASAAAALFASPILGTAVPPDAVQAKGPAAVEAGTCSPAQRAAITQAFADARDLALRSAAFLEERGEDPHVERFFGNSPRKVLAEHYRIIATGTERLGELDLRCEDQRVCGNGGTFAYIMHPHAQRPRAVAGFCRSFFTAAASTGQDNRAGIVIHEISHLVLDTRDAEYQPRAAQDLAKDEPAVAAMNADNYEYFAEFMPR